MARRDRIDALGAVALVGFSALLGFNQVVIRVVNEGLQPVFFAGLRSAGAVLCLGLWFAVRQRPFGLCRADLGPGTLMGGFFAAEFVFLFIALDLTTVSRASIFFYTMPLWLALFAHVLIPGERITPVKATGQVLAFAGVTIAILARGEAGEVSLAGDGVLVAGIIEGTRTWPRTASFSGRSPHRRLSCLLPRSFSAPSSAIWSRSISGVWRSRSSLS